MYRMKHFVSNKILMMVYTTLILPHINGLLAWGYSNTRIFKLQKNQVWIIMKSIYLSNSEPHYKHLNLLNISDLLIINQLTFLYKLANTCKLLSPLIIICLHVHTRIYNSPIAGIISPQLWVCLLYICHDLYQVFHYSPP